MNNCFKISHLIRFEAFLLLLILLAVKTEAQSVLFEKEYFANQKEAFKIALADFKDGNSKYERNYYFEALTYFLKAQDFNPSNAELNFKIGVCYLQTEMRFMCLNYFKKAFELDREIHPDIHYMLGRGFHLNQNFESAIIEYKAHLASLRPEDRKEEKAGIDKRIAECESGIKLLDHAPAAFVDNMGTAINSAYLDHSPLISADESLLVFTSTRPNGRKIGVDGQYDEDIYISQRQGKKWLEPESVGEPINTQFNDATVGLSPDGQKLLIYNGNRGNGDIEICWLEGDAWNYPKALPDEINSEDKETAACFSPDGKKLYFVSDRPGGIGGSDIYCVEKNEKGKWSEPINLGRTINSPYNEESVYMHPDGRTLYFSSEGHNTIGGYDIFVSHLGEDAKWSEPENLGFPVNTPDDDLCFVISANGRHGFCSSIRKDSYGGFDLYQMTFLGPEKPVMLSNEDFLIAVRANPVSQIAIEENVAIKTIRLTIVKGMVTDAITNEPVNAQIDIVDNEKNEVIFTSTTNSSTGKFLVSLPSGKNYGLIVKADNYLFHSENFNIPGATEYQEITKQIMLSNLKKDAKIILKNVFFETASSKLRPSSYAELGRLTKLLNDNPNLRIEISGHTDNKGSKQANQKLSEARAKAVVDFLITEGVAKERLEYKGYAFDQPIADNATEDGRAQNRRVEFKVLGN
jgi:outer membrane protein OmpA-like peptidoglycan-associated protein/tetratricopeptide (TPR) repeat protein